MKQRRYNQIMENLDLFMRDYESSGIVYGMLHTKLKIKIVLNFLKFIYRHGRGRLSIKILSCLDLWTR